MQHDGAGFAGFATWLDMTPADPDMLAMPDPDSLIQLPWKPEVGWLAADPWMAGKPVEQAPRNVLKRVIAQAAAQGLDDADRRRMRVLPDLAGRTGDRPTPADRQAKPCYDQSALMRRYDVITEICDAMLALGWGPYQNDHEDANGQFEMNWQYAPRAGHRRPACVLQIHGQGDRRKARHARDLHAETVRRPDRLGLPRACLAVARRAQLVRRWQRASWGCRRLRYHFMAGVLAHAAALCAHHQSDGEFLQAHQRADDDIRRHLVAEQRHATAATTART